MKKELIVVSEKDLSKVEDNALNSNQLGFLFKPTPAIHVKTRPAKGGGVWSYVTGTYVKKVLNLMFGWKWNHEVVDYTVDNNSKQVIVHGKLTCHTEGWDIVKHQFGRADIKYKVEWTKDPKTNKSIKTVTNQPLDLGNDLKAATTDSLKKCAAELGIAADVYAPNEFKELQVESEGEREEPTYELLKMIFDNIDVFKLPEDELLNIERILDEKESTSYAKAIKYLRKYE